MVSPSDKRVASGADPRLDHLPDPAFAVDEAGTLVWANSMASTVLGWRLDDVIGRRMFDLVHPDDLNLARASFESVAEKPFGGIVNVRVRSSESAWISLEVRGMRSDDGTTVFVARDAAGRHDLDADTGDVELLRSIVANMHGMVLLVEPDGDVRSCNGSVTRQLGHDPERMRGQSFAAFIHPDDRDHVLDLLARTAPHSSTMVEARFADASGHHWACEFSINNLTDDPVVGGYLVSGQVATELADARTRVAFLAEHDIRTGLLNRDGFIRETTEMMRRGGGLGLLLIDVVQFRSINELYGEGTGDHLLGEIADRLDGIRWPDLILARLAGDEFVMAVRASSDSSIEMLEDRVRRAVGETLDITEQEIKFGIRTATAFEDRPSGLEPLLASASTEMMRIKRNAEPSSEGVSVDALNQRRRQLEELRAALDDGQIRPFFQPIVRADGTIRAVEALVRWVSPLRGVRGVGEILPLAQMAGLADVIDDRVLDVSLDFAAQLASLGHSEVEVHVNVDPKVISQGSFAARFLHLCEQRGTDPSQMVVELTETDLIAPGAALLTNMHELRRAGTHIAIDDFGTGYSSLSHLLELPVDGVKIDRRFVAGIDVDPTATNLTTAILGLSQSLDLTCVAEGVEQPFQRDRLHALGCESFQGWLYAPAVDPDELLALLPRIVLDEAPAPAPVHV